ncbi:MAG: VWA domain-containing protein [Nannocystaceae bacterium]|nr:VWA domain-containing protein [Nannocystaceae bacterium]
MGRCQRLGYLGAGAFVFTAACGPSIEVEDGGTGDLPGDSTGATTAMSSLEGEGEGEGEGEADTTTSNPVDTSVDDTGGPALTNLVDIFFVVDNSGSMGEEQGVFATATATLVARLDELDVDYRIGMTTTDNSNPWCPGTTPEAGQFRLSSCRSRLNEFTFSGAVMIDASDVGCLDVCGAEMLNVTPTPDEAGQMAQRPWIEVTDGVSNIDGLSVAEALACAIPQGINGCGFEQPLESLHKAIGRTNNDDEPAYGFFRPGSLRVVVVVSDEADCSYQDESIFLPDGPRTFWSLPEEGSPTSAVCWHAGVGCSNGDCFPVDLDPGGADTNDASAVMFPVSRYTASFQALEDDAKTVTPGADLLMALIGGFNSDGSVTYADAVDPEFMDNFGIGPGCSSELGEAVPMVRLLAVAQAFDTGDAVATHSICEEHQSAMTSLGDRIAASLGR